MTLWAVEHETRLENEVLHLLGTCIACTIRRSLSKWPQSSSEVWGAVQGTSVAALAVWTVRDISTGGRFPTDSQKLSGSRDPCSRWSRTATPGGKLCGYKAPITPKSPGNVDRLSSSTSMGNSFSTSSSFLSFKIHEVQTCTWIPRETSSSSTASSRSPILTPRHTYTTLRGIHVHWIWNDSVLSV